MTTVQRYTKASTWREALSARAADPAARYLAGGTFILAGDETDKPEAVIDLGASLPRGFEPSDDSVAIGAGTSFQEIAESAWAAGSARGDASPPYLVEAALSMKNRNTRNRATLGGNLGADKSCSSLLPILLVLGAEVEVASPASPEPERLSLEAWLAERDTTQRRDSDLVLRVLIPIGTARRAAYRRWNRVSCDLSVLGAAAAYELDKSPNGGRVKDLRIALGGLGPKSRRRPDLEALFEGRPLPGRAEIETAVAPLLKPLSDLRASAEFKRLRGAQLLADALLEASAIAAAVAGTEAAS
jgi:CO/xanthine dehydrogenase FAD-binding subunit